MKATGQATKLERESYEGLPIKQTKNKPPKITNDTSTDVTFGGAWSRRVVAKQQGSSR